jgi:hypothetical protein
MRLPRQDIDCKRRRIRPNTAQLGIDDVTAPAGLSAIDLSRSVTGGTIYDRVVDRPCPGRVETSSSALGAEL